MSMYRYILPIAESKLSGRFDNVIDDIRSLISTGCTGGEITSMVGKYLKDLETTNQQVYEILIDDILFYLNECRKQGLYII
ncbi:MAG: hypothetical protein ACK4EY_01095 [Flavipsychrobacter sp.]